MIVLPAHAKLNLALEVTGRAAGGLHSLESVLVRIDWHDLVGVTTAPRATTSTGDSLALRVSGDAGSVPNDATNLAVRAALLAAKLTGAPPPTSMWLLKRVPAAAGLGGGSADAAAAIRLMQRLAGTDSDPDPPGLTEAAAALGADIPALLAGGAQLVRGTGEQLEPLPTPLLHTVVVQAAPSSTAVAYSALDAAELWHDGRAATLAAQLRRGAAPDLSLFGSALEAPALRSHPELARAVAELRGTWPSFRWHLTGSGGALFAVVEEALVAARLADEVMAAGWRARACRTAAV